jgi:hypothetical protein
VIAGPGDAPVSSVSALALGSTIPETLSKSNPKSSTNSTLNPLPLLKTPPASSSLIPTHSLLTLHDLEQYPSSLFPCTSVMDRFIVEILNFLPGLYGARGGFLHIG